MKSAVPDPAPAPPPDVAPPASGDAAWTIEAENLDGIDAVNAGVAEEFATEFAFAAGDPLAFVPPGEVLDPAAARFPPSGAAAVGPDWVAVPLAPASLLVGDGAEVVVGSTWPEPAEDVGAGVGFAGGGGVEAADADWAGDDG